MKVVWDSSYTYIYTDPDSYEPLAQARNWTNEEEESRQQNHYFHCDQIGIPERNDRHPWQSVVVRRIHRLGSSEKGRAGSSIKAALSHLCDGVRVKFKII